MLVLHARTRCVAYNLRGVANVLLAQRSAIRLPPFESPIMAKPGLWDGGMKLLNCQLGSDLQEPTLTDTDNAQTTQQISRRHEDPGISEY